MGKICHRLPGRSLPSRRSPRWWIHSKMTWWRWSHPPGQRRRWPEESLLTPAALSNVCTLLSLCLIAFFIFHSREIKDQGSRVHSKLCFRSCILQLKKQISNYNAQPKKWISVNKFQEVSWRSVKLPVTSKLTLEWSMKFISFRVQLSVWFFFLDLFTFICLYYLYTNTNRVQILTFGSISI